MLTVGMIVDVNLLGFFFLMLLFLCVQVWIHSFAKSQLYS